MVLLFANHPKMGVTSILNEVRVRAGAMYISVVSPSLPFVDRQSPEQPGRDEVH